MRQALMGALCGSGTAARLSAPERMDAMRREVFARARSLTAALGGDASAVERMEPEALGIIRSCDRMEMLAGMEGPAPMR